MNDPKIKRDEIYIGIVYQVFDYEFIGSQLIIKSSESRSLSLFTIKDKKANDLIYSDRTFHILGVTKDEDFDKKDKIDELIKEYYKYNFNFIIGRYVNIGKLLEYLSYPPILTKDNIIEITSLINLGEIYKLNPELKEQINTNVIDINKKRNELLTFAKKIVQENEFIFTHSSSQEEINRAHEIIIKSIFLSKETQERVMEQIIADFNRFRLSCEEERYLEIRKKIDEIMKGQIQESKTKIIIFPKNK